MADLQAGRKQQPPARQGLGAPGGKRKRRSGSWAEERHVCQTRHCRACASAAAIGALICPPLTRDPRPHTNTSPSSASSSESIDCAREAAARALGPVSIVMRCDCGRHVPQSRHVGDLAHGGARWRWPRAVLSGVVVRGSMSNENMSFEKNKGRHPGSNWGAGVQHSGAARAAEAGGAHIRSAVGTPAGRLWICRPC